MYNYLLISFQPYLLSLIPPFFFFLPFSFPLFPFLHQHYFLLFLPSFLLLFPISLSFLFHPFCIILSHSSLLSSSLSLLSSFFFPPPSLFSLIFASHFPFLFPLPLPPLLFSLIPSLTRTLMALAKHTVA